MLAIPKYFIGKMGRYIQKQTDIVLAKSGNPMFATYMIFLFQAMQTITTVSVVLNLIFIVNIFIHEIVIFTPFRYLKLMFELVLEFISLIITITFLFYDLKLIN